MSIRSLRSLLVCTAVLVFVSAPVAAQPQISVGTTSHQLVFAQPGTTLTVSIANGPANPLDWVGLFAVGAPDSHASLAWSYLNGLQTAPTVGATSASLGFQAPGTAGLYEFRFYRNNSFERLATSAPVLAPTVERRVLVNNSAFPTVVTGIAGTSVRVDVLNGPGNARDWVGLYPIGASNQGSLDWAYLNGTRMPPTSGMMSATLTFALPATGGSYEFRFFQNDGYTLLEKSTVVDVSSPAKLMLNGIEPPTSVSVLKNSTVTVGVSGGPANATDWVGLFLSGAADSNWTARQYLNGAATPPATGTTAAELTFATPSNGGTYEFRFFTAGTLNRLTTSAPLLVNAPTAQLAVNSMVPPAVIAAAPGTIVSVQLTNGPGGATDWVAMAATTAPNTTNAGWKYLNGLTTAPSQGVTSATLSFTLPTTPGTYEFRFFGNNGYGRLATSSPIMVASSGVNIALVQPAAGASLTSPSNVMLAASVSAINRTISKVDFFTGTTLIGTATSTPYQVTWPTPTAGAHTLTAVATDDTFATTTSGAVGITITGALATPTATPPAGAYRPGQTVTLNGPSGSQIRYTTDGSVPTAASPIYTGPLTLTQTTVLKAKAFQSGWVTSPALLASYAIDSLGPTIAATYNPSPNTNGWNTSPVTISFMCIDASGVVNCPTDVTFSEEGANQQALVTATDSAGNLTTSIFNVNIDMTPPSLTVISPVDHHVTGASTVALVASVADGLAGVSSVNCDRALAQVTGSQAQCTAVLFPGSNALIVQAMDAAGNSSSKSVNVMRTGAGTTLAIFPHQPTLSIGEQRALQLVDDFGSIVPNATWTSSSPAVGSISNDGTVTALQVGSSTITASVGGLLANTVITIGSGILASGTILWSVPTPVDSTVSDIIPAHRTDVEDAALFIIERESDGGSRFRALTDDGRQVRTGPLIGSLLFADSFGGLVTLESGQSKSALIRSAGPVGVAPWRFESQQPLDSVVGQAPDGTIYAIQKPISSLSDTFVIGIDGATGQQRFRVPIPHSTTSYSEGAVCGAPIARTEFTPQVSSLSLSSSGKAYVGFVTAVVSGEECTASVSGTFALRVLRVDTNGENTLGTLREYTNTWVVNFTGQMPIVSSLVSDGQDGVLVEWREHEAVGDLGYETSEARISHVSGNGEVVEYANQWGTPTLIDTEGRAYFSSAAYVTPVEVATGVSHAPIPGVYPVVALAHSELLAVDDQLNLITFNSSSQQTHSEHLSFYPSFQASDDTFMGFDDQSHAVRVATVSYQNQTAVPNPLRAGGPTLPTIVTFVTVDDLMQPGSVLSYPAANFEENFRTALRDDGKNGLVSSFARGESATLEGFLSEAKRLVSAVGFIGHAYEFEIPPASNNLVSVGLRFRNPDHFTGERVLLKAPPGYLEQIPGMNQQQTDAYAKFVQVVESNARVIFIASCRVGDTFKSMWDIAEGSGRALIVPLSQTLDVDLNIAGAVWMRIATRLALGWNVREAVADGNAYAETGLGRPDHKWDIVGDKDFPVRP